MILISLRTSVLISCMWLPQHVQTCSSSGRRYSTLSTGRFFSISSRWPCFFTRRYVMVSTVGSSADGSACASASLNSRSCSESVSVRSLEALNSYCWLSRSFSSYKASFSVKSETCCSSDMHLFCKDSIVSSEAIVTFFMHVYFDKLRFIPDENQAMKEKYLMFLYYGACGHFAVSLSLFKRQSI